MSANRGVMGAILGASVAAIALRVHAASKKRKQPLLKTALDLPTILTDDAQHIRSAALSAVSDGKAAQQEAKAEFDKQVAARSR